MFIITSEIRPSYLLDYELIYCSCNCLLVDVSFYLFVPIQIGMVPVTSHTPLIYSHTNTRIFQVKGRDITEEERKMLEEDGVTIPYNVVLTKVHYTREYWTQVN